MANTISRQTSVTLGLVIGLFVFITALSFRFGTQFERAAAERAALRKDVQTLHDEVAALADDRWPRSDAQSYHDFLDRLNPEVQFPPVPENGH